MKTVEELYIDEFGVCPMIEKEIPLHTYYDLISFAKKCQEEIDDNYLNDLKIMGTNPNKTR